jgi:hypothetical protein
MSLTPEVTPEDAEPTPEAPVAKNKGVLQAYFKPAKTVGKAKSQTK